MVADLNGDLVADLVSAKSSGSVSVMLGNGPSGFSAPIDTSTGGSGAEAVAVVDVNSDTIPDVIVANSGSNNVSVLLGDGTGHFASTQYATGTSPGDLVVSDFNGDTHPDVATVNANSNSITVLLGAANGTFSAPQPNYSTISIPDRLDREISTTTPSPTSSWRAAAQARWRFCWATGTEPSAPAP